MFKYFIAFLWGKYIYLFFILKRKLPGIHWWKSYKYGWCIFKREFPSFYFWHCLLICKCYSLIILSISCQYFLCFHWWPPIVCQSPVDKNYNCDIAKERSIPLFSPTGSTLVQSCIMERLYSTPELHLIQVYFSSSYLLLDHPELISLGWGCFLLRLFLVDLWWGQLEVLSCCQPGGK